MKKLLIYAMVGLWVSGAIAGDKVIQFDSGSGAIDNVTALSLPGSFAPTTLNVSSTGSFGGTVSAADPTNTTDLVTLRYLDRALGSVAILYASTNQDLGVAGYYDARTFLPTHAAVTISVAGVTNNQYLAMWVSNTNLISNIRRGIGVVHYRMRLNSPVAGKTLVVKPEVYRRTVADGDLELYEAGENITLSGTMTEDDANIDCSTNAAFDVTDRAVVKWKVVSQTGNPTWYFECGTPYIIAARFPVSLGGGADAVTIGTAQTVTGAKVLSAFNGTLNGTLDASGNNVTNVGALTVTNANVDSTIAGSASIALSPFYYVSNSMATRWDIYFNTNALANASWNIWRAGGTISTPSATTNAMAGTFNFRVYDGSNWKQSSLLQFITDETCSVGSTPSYIKFYTTPSGSSTVNERMRITSAGAVRVIGGNAFPSGVAGDIFYHTTSNKHFGYNGSSWNALY